MTRELGRCTCAESFGFADGLPPYSTELLFHPEDIQLPQGEIWSRMQLKTIEHPTLGGRVHLVNTTYDKVHYSMKTLLRRPACKARLVMGKSFSHQLFHLAQKNRDSKWVQWTEELFQKAKDDVLLSKLRSFKHFGESSSDEDCYPNLPSSDEEETINFSTFFQLDQ